jgi:hypothetical protein
MFETRASVPLYKKFQFLQNVYNDNYSKRHIIITVAIQTSSASCQHGLFAQSLYFDFEITAYSNGLFQV